MSDLAPLLPNFSAVPATDSPTDTDAAGAATAPTAGADTGNGPPPERSDDLMIEVDGQLVPNYAATIKPINEHDVVTGEVVRIDKDEVLVDIGYKSEGVIPATELSIRRSVDPADEVSLGDRVDALVLTKEDAEGRLILSKKRARFEKAWRRIEAAAESGEPVEGTVIEVVKGGLILDLGVRGFLPASLVDIRRVHNLDEFMGQQLECKVIELNRSRNNVVLSRRAVLEEERKEVRQQILGRLQPGQVVEGKISNIVDFGAFVDPDGIEGLIHISELSWSHVNHPSEVLSIGDTVRVKVLDIDRDRQRISLGLKQTQEDPWQRVLDSYGPGDILEGNVTKVVAFGAFVEIVPGVEGLVHISELANHHVESPGEVASPGDEVRVKILEIDEERRRISLSIKRVEGQGLPLRDVQVPEPAPPADGAAEAVPDLGLSEEVFSESPPEVARPDGEAAPADGEEAAGVPEQASGEGAETRGEGSRDDE
jgi:small subunit ribosomal protein S1